MVVFGVHVTNDESHIEIMKCGYIVWPYKWSSAQWVDVIHNFQTLQFQTCFITISADGGEEIAAILMS